MMLLEAQLEKQSDQQGAMEELEEVHQLLRCSSPKNLHHHIGQEIVLLHLHKNADYFNFTLESSASGVSGPKQKKK